MIWAKFIEQVRRQVNGGDPPPGSHPMAPEVVLVASAKAGELIRAQYINDYGVLRVSQLPGSAYITFVGVPIQQDGTRHYLPLPAIPALDEPSVFYPDDRTAQFVKTTLRALAAVDNTALANMMAAEKHYLTYYENTGGQPRMYLHTKPSNCQCLDVSMIPGSYEPASYSEQMPVPGELEGPLLRMCVQYFLGQSTGEDDVADNREIATKP